MNACSMQGFIAASPPACLLACLPSCSDEPSAGQVSKKQSMKVVLITGFESFNVELYKKAAVALARACPGISLRVFSDRDLGAHLAAALHSRWPLFRVFLLISCHLVTSLAACSLVLPRALLKRSPRCRCRLQALDERRLRLRCKVPTCSSPHSSSTLTRSGLTAGAGAGAGVEAGAGAGA